MILNLFELKRDIASILIAKVPPNVPVYLSDQGNPPVDNWITVELREWSQAGTDVEDYENQNLNSTSYRTSSIYYVTLRVVTVGTLSDQYIMQISHDFNKEYFRDSFSALGLSFLSKSGIQRAPRMISDGWEERHVLDVKFNICITDTDQIDFIDIIEVTHEIKNELGNVIYTDTKEIDI